MTPRKQQKGFELTDAGLVLMKDLLRPTIKSAMEFAVAQVTGSSSYGMDSDFWFEAFWKQATAERGRKRRETET
jgi:hypothetical protein